MNFTEFSLVDTMAGIESTVPFDSSKTQQFVEIVTNLIGTVHFFSPPSDIVSH